jgi:F5/8 type C domain
MSIHARHSRLGNIRMHGDSSLMSLRLSRTLLGVAVIALAGCSATNATPTGSSGGAAGTGGSTVAVAGFTGSGGASGLAGSGGASIGMAGSAGSAGAASGGGGNSNGGTAGSAAGQGGAGGAGGTGGTSNSHGGAGGARANLALNQPATASSIEQGDHAAIRINDGDLVTRWVSVMAVYPQWNQIDLLTPHRIDTVLVWPYMLRAYQFLLEGSLDSVTYFPLSDQSANTVGGDSIPVVFTAQSTRFVRITISGASGYDKGWSAINEMEIFEAP